MKTLGIQHNRTTAYHPASNGLIERFHRQLKAALRAHQDPAWSEILPFVLISLRSTVKPDLNASPSELAYGRTLRLPGELIAPRPGGTYNYGQYVDRLREHMRRLQPATTRPQSPPSYVPPELSSCRFVFLRDDRPRSPLRPPYRGPYRVIQRGPKTFVIDQDGRREVVSIDRLKPGFVEEDSHERTVSAPLDNTSHTSHREETVTDTTSSNSTEQSTVQQEVRTNARGRRVRQPVRFADFVT